MFNIHSCNHLHAWDPILPRKFSSSSGFMQFKHRPRQRSTTLWYNFFQLQSCVESPWFHPQSKSSSPSPKEPKKGILNNPKMMDNVFLLFLDQYKQTGASEWSYVLSAPNSNAYIGMGFSPNGQMVGSSAIVGWVGSDGTPAMKKYYLGGKNSNQVMPDQGNLEIGNSTIVTFSSRIYMAFQLVNTDTPDSLLIYSFGPQNQIPSPPSFRLTQHSDYVSTVLNYATGTPLQTLIFT